jgi:hypothetical protein
LKLFEQKPDEPAELEPTPSAPTRYSQPLPVTMRDVSGPIVVAGFIGRGANKRPGFIFLNENGKVERQEATRENSAVEHPGRFGAALGRLWAAVGGKP